MVHKRNLSDLPMESLKSRLLCLCDVSDDVDPNTLLEHYHSVVKTDLDELAPIKSKVLVDGPRAPWYDAVFGSQEGAAQSRKENG